MVRVGAGIDAAEPAVRPLRHLPRRHLQRRVQASPGLPTAHHLRRPRRRRNILRNLLPEHSRHPLLQKPQKAQVQFQVPSLRRLLQERRRRRQAAGLHRGGAAVHRLQGGARERRSPVARCVSGADVSEGGVRDFEGQPAVEPNPIHHHL